MIYQFISQRIKEQVEYLKSLPDDCRQDVRESAMGQLEYFMGLAKKMCSEIGRSTSDDWMKWCLIPMEIQFQLDKDKHQFGVCYVMLNDDGSFTRLDPTRVRATNAKVNIYPMPQHYLGEDIK